MAAIARLPLEVQVPGHHGSSPWDALAFESSRAALHDFATQRWQPVYASPVQDLVWLQPSVPKPRAAAAARPVSVPRETARRRAAPEPVRA